MKTLTLVVTCIFFVSTIGCVEPEEVLLVRSCGGFDFTVPERDWIAFPPGIEYSFSSAEKKIEIISKYTISEPFDLRYDPNELSVGEEPNCLATFKSGHSWENSPLLISDDIAYLHPKGNLFMKLKFGGMYVDLKILNDTLTGVRITNTTEADEFEFQNFSSLSLDGKQFFNVFKISHSNPNIRPKEIYLAKRLGLVAFVDKDSLWVRD